MITLNPKPKLLIENTLILPGYTLSKQSIVDLQSIVCNLCRITFKYVS